MWYAACDAVEQHRDAARVRHAARSRATGLIVPSAFDMCVIDDQPRARAEQPLELLEDQLAAVVDRRDAQPRARRLADAAATARCSSGAPSPRSAPRRPARSARPREAVRDEVDPLGGVAREDDLARSAGVEERADALARRLVGVGRPLAQLVDAAVDVGVDRRA